MVSLKGVKACSSVCALMQNRDTSASDECLEPCQVVAILARVLLLPMTGHAVPPGVWLLSEPGQCPGA